jgi:putative zinc finger/helix-turn-helix YgiT family protein
MSTVIQTDKTSLKPIIPDFCPSCDAVENPFRSTLRKTKQEYRGEILEVETPALKCKECEFHLLAPGHLDAIRITTANAYRRKHGLLTAGEIIQRRKAMGMSQRRFAQYLEVGEASVKRWESGLLVQDKASDLRVRAQTDHTKFTEGFHFSTGMDSLAEQCFQGVFQALEGTIEKGKPARWITDFIDTQRQAEEEIFSYDLTVTA